MVEVKDRKENMVLGRVEMVFSVTHDGERTPSRNELIEMVAKQEPGSKKELIIILDVNTRFGQSQTSALAHIYSSKEQMDNTEAKYLLEKHKSDDDANDESEDSGSEGSDE